jgi:two-component system, cell cycle response regulator
MSSGTEFNGGQTARYHSEEIRNFRASERTPTLVVLLGYDTSLQIPLDKTEITLGRTGDADVVLHDDQISRRHILIRSDPATKTYRVVDLNSTNGTRVNLLPVSEAVLKEGDKIFIGSSVLKFVMQDELESEHRDVVNRWAFIDDLTGLVVKRQFDVQLRFEVRRAGERAEKFCLLMMDMDGLKAINDASGHTMGAFVISEVGRLIGELVNPLGLVSRFGGDEFTAYLTNHDLEKGKKVAERIRSAVEARVFEKDGKRHKATISIGIAVFPDRAREVEAITKAADEALYRAKAKGRNCISI